MSKNDPRKALGKGLHSLLPGRNASAPAASATAAAPEAPVDGNVLLVPIEQVKPNPHQPRRDFDPDTMAELTGSIEREGIIQPIIVRRTATDEYQIIAGERRWRAATAAGLKEIPVIPRAATDDKVLELAIIENIQREDLNSIELALAFQRMAVELGMSHDQIGEKTGKDRATITNLIRLLQLPEEVQRMVVNNWLTPGHARALLKLTGETNQIALAQLCASEGWSVRQIEAQTRSGKPPRAKSAAKQREPQAQDPNVKAAVTEMEAKLGTRVRIVEKAANKGMIEIEYYSTDDLDRIYNVIVGENL